MGLDMQSVDGATSDDDTRTVYLLLGSWCRDEGDFVVGVFSTRELALAARVEICKEACRDPVADRVLRVEKVEMNAITPGAKEEISR
jgi:hypothetical protein